MKSLSTPLMIFIGFVLILCCCCIVIIALGLAGFLIYEQQQVDPVSFEPTVQVFQSTELPVSTDSLDPTETPSALATAAVIAASDITDTLSVLEDTIIPVNDPRELACRLSDICNIPETVPSGPFSLGDRQKFWVMNTDTNDYVQVAATLQYLTEHAYFWVQDDVNYNKNQAKKLLDVFESKIYPTNREFFGSEWSPGVDEDPHIYILYARKIGNNTAGYFSSADAYSPAANEYSNAHEMFIFSADNSPLDSIYTYGVLAHEFQHMIHWRQDRNESTWLNEGSAELAVLLNGYYSGYADQEYAYNTDIQLTDWGSDIGSNGPHYGSSFLFMTYFLDRFGEKATQALVRAPQNSMDSVDSVLASLDVKDPLTGQLIRADDVFLDWAVTNYLQDGAVADGRYQYHNYDDAPQVYQTETLTGCPADYSSTVNQYGVDYIRISCSGSYTLHFSGDPSTRIFPTDVYSGKYAFWSNKGDESDMTLTREFDLGGLSGPVTLKYQTWYDLEQDFDYLYLAASTDGGKTWQILMTPSGTGEDPSGNSYGWGYNGSSDGWIEESVDLSQFAGEKVQIRFEYITDGAVNGEGLVLDDISIPEINYFTDFENGPDGWESSGFVLVENSLPQTFQLALIATDGETSVKNITLGPGEVAEISLDLHGSYEATLVISGTTRFTRELASYQLSVK